MSRYIPTPAYPHMMPVDISAVFANEKPAGKHGFCCADGDDLRFADGTLARFWGVNINGSANFPEKSYAEIFAGRIAQSGCNLVRFHQIDAEWATSNIFACPHWSAPDRRVCASMRAVWSACLRHPHRCGNA